MFLDDFDFAKLIHPFDSGRFFEQAYEQKPLLIQRRNPNYYEGLLSPKDLDDIFFHWPGSLSVVNAKENEGSRTSMGSSALQRYTQSVLKDIDDGKSVILDSLENRHPPLTRMCALLEQEHGWPYQANVYITPPNSQGFKTHADDHNVFILQTTGSKKWRVNLAPTPLELRSEDNRNQKIDDRNSLNLELEQGDLLYIPREFAHDAASINSSSVHITLSPHPPTWISTIGFVLRQSKQNLTMLEKSLPPKYLNQPPDVVASEISKLLKELANSDLTIYLQKMFKERQSDFRGLFFGALEQRLAPSPIDLGMAFRKNPLLMMEIQVNGEQILVRTPEKVVDLPSLFREQVGFCLSGQVFTGSDIPGMGVEEQLVLIGRLRGEGLIVEEHVNHARSF